MYFESRERLVWKSLYIQVRIVLHLCGVKNSQFNRELTTSQSDAYLNRKPRKHMLLVLRYSRDQELSPFYGVSWSPMRNTPSFLCLAVSASIPYTKYCRQFEVSDLLYTPQMVMLLLDSMARRWNEQITVKTSGHRRQCDDDAPAVPLVLLFLAYSPTSDLSKLAIQGAAFYDSPGRKTGERQFNACMHAQTVLTAQTDAAIIILVSVINLYVWQRSRGASMKSWTTVANAKLALYVYAAEMPHTKNFRILREPTNILMQK